MASVDLTDLNFEEAVPTPLQFGRLLRPQTGGAIQRIDRLGNRWMIACRTPVMPIEPDGRLIGARLNRAVRDGGYIRIRQPNFDVGAPGTPLVNGAVSSGRTVDIDGLTPGYAIRDGQWVSFVTGGARYLDCVDAQVIADSSGEATITLHNLLRAPLADNATVELGLPRLEGVVEITSPAPWPRDRLTYFEFTVTEAK